jgi:lipoprotein-anchoring transpeptidase ErfK/SrfK
MPANLLSRRVAVAALPLVLTSCITPREQIAPAPFTTDKQRIVPPQVAALYAAMPHERFPIPEVDFDDVDPSVLRRIVDDPTGEAPGTLVVDTRARALFLVMENAQALRYGVGVGKEGLAWQGRAVIARKAEWPRWTPTKDMITREPEKNAKWASGMEPGLDNPLGARALYLYRDNRDTLYRIHGTNDPSSIGTAVSSGCIRLINQDIIDLYNRVPEGSKVLVRQ